VCVRVFAIQGMNSVIIKHASDNFFKSNNNTSHTFNLLELSFFSVIVAVDNYRHTNATLNLAVFNTTIAP